MQSYSMLSLGHSGLTHWSRDKMATIFQTTFSNAFSWMKVFEFQFRTFHWSLFPRVQLTIFQHWFRKWLGSVQATSHYVNQWWPVYWCIYASLGFNELTVPTTHLVSRFHCLNQCWHSSMWSDGITRPQWLNSLWPSDAICLHLSGSTLAQVMACWTNVDLSSVKSNNIHWRALVQK